jgi:3-oxoacyl-[acyl-carrier-protein] synthase-3
MTMDLQTFHREVVAFFAQTTGRSMERLGLDTNFVREGLVDSMRFIELFAFVERLIGREISTQGFRMDRFDTVRKIHESCHADAPGAAAAAPAPQPEARRATATAGADPLIAGLAYRVGEPRPLSQLAELGVEPEILELLAAGGLEMYACTRDSAAELARACMRDTLDRTGCAPGEVDAVLFANESAWTGAEAGPEPAVDVRRAFYRVLHELGLERAFPLGLGMSGCASMLAGVAMARGLILGGELRRILVVGSDRRDDRRRLIPPAVGVISDGAASCLVSAGATSGFAVEAFCQHANLALHAHDLASDFGAYLLEMGKSVRELGARMRALTGRGPEQYRRLVVNNYGMSTMRAFTVQLGFRLDQLYRTNAARLSHVAAADVVINLADLEAAGQLNDGDRVMAFASGPVSWIMAALRKVG